MSCTFNRAGGLAVPPPLRAAPCRRRVESSRRRIGRDSVWTLNLATAQRPAKQADDEGPAVAGKLPLQATGIAEVCPRCLLHGDQLCPLRPSRRARLSCCRGVERNG